MPTVMEKNSFNNNDVREICENQIQSGYCDEQVKKNIFTGCITGKEIFKSSALSQETDR